MPSEEISFLGGDGENWLAGRLDTPPHPPVAHALFAHCFTCTHDMFAVSKFTRVLNEYGIALFRFDFTGLGGSEGDFAETNFTSNIHDILAAANWLRTNKKAPKILIGHSLGGTAVVAAGRHVPECEAVCTIAAPSDPAFLRDVMRDHIPEIETQGEAEVPIVGRPFRIQKQFLDDFDNHSMEALTDALGRPLLILHSAGDEIVSIGNAETLFRRARWPKSFVSLDPADHYLSRGADAAFAAEIVVTWAKRHVSDLEAGYAKTRS